MKIKFYEVYITQSPGGDGCGPSICIGRFTKESDAIDYAKGKDEWGRDGRIKEVELDIQDNVKKQYEVLLYEDSNNNPFVYYTETGRMSAPNYGINIQARKPSPHDKKLRLVHVHTYEKNNEKH